MTPSETKSIVTLSLLAAFVDGEKHEREREEIKRIAEGLSQADGVNLPTLYQDVLMKRVSLASVAGELKSTEARQLAYEMAVCVCDADGTQSQAERMFLADVRTSLGLDASAAGFSQQAEEIAAVPVAAAAAAAGAATVAVATAAGAPNLPDSAELDKSILNAAILNGALELLPETLSTMAIIPLQMKLVYRIGQAHGYQLDSGHIKDFLATVGVGLTSQYLEQAGRKLLGGLLGRSSSRIGHSGRSSPWQQWIRCCSVRCISCIAAIRCASSSACFCAMRRTLALARLRFCHRPTSSAISSIEKPRSRERLMKRSVCTSASLYWR
jgi:tellurite resistance protein